MVGVSIDMRRAHDLGSLNDDRHRKGVCRVRDERGEQTFGQFVRTAREARGWSRATLSVRLGEVGEKRQTYGDMQVTRIERDDRRYLDPALVARLIEVLDLDAGEAWAAAYPDIIGAWEAARTDRAVIPPSGAAAVNPSRNSASYSPWPGQRAA